MKKVFLLLAILFSVNSLFSQTFNNPPNSTPGLIDLETSLCFPGSNFRAIINPYLCGDCGGKIEVETNFGTNECEKYSYQYVFTLSDGTKKIEKSFFNLSGVDYLTLHDGSIYDFNLPLKVRLTVWRYDNSEEISFPSLQAQKEIYINSIAQWYE
ncbi:hypothetical protein [Aureivirga marina]|uniref:hypothetical protein n=1 Tax=Aureivirga marina TaxID=1182451 RepID=UPI0018CAD530|nr:hypothetical protein [Aureivirga marina]